MTALAAAAAYLLTRRRTHAHARNADLVGSRVAARDAVIADASWTADDDAAAYAAWLEDAR